MARKLDQNNALLEKILAEMQAHREANPSAWEHGADSKGGSGDVSAVEAYEGMAEMVKELKEDRMDFAKIAESGEEQREDFRSEQKEAFDELKKAIEKQGDNVESSISTALVPYVPPGRNNFKDAETEERETEAMGTGAYAEIIANSKLPKEQAMFYGAMSNYMSMIANPIANIDANLQYLSDKQRNAREKSDIKMADEGSDSPGSGAGRYGGDNNVDEDGADSGDGYLGKAAAGFGLGASSMKLLKKAGKYNKMSKDINKLRKANAGNTSSEIWEGTHKGNKVTYNSKTGEYSRFDKTGKLLAKGKMGTRLAQSIKWLKVGGGIMMIAGIAYGAIVVNGIVQDLKAVEETDWVDKGDDSEDSSGDEKKEAEANVSGGDSGNAPDSKSDNNLPAVPQNSSPGGKADSLKVSAVSQSTKNEASLEASAIKMQAYDESKTQIASAAVGMAAGGKIGAIAGSFLCPGLGTLAGIAIGIVIGLVVTVLIDQIVKYLVDWLKPVSWKKKKLASALANHANNIHTQGKVCMRIFEKLRDGKDGRDAMPSKMKENFPKDYVFKEDDAWLFYCMSQECDNAKRNVYKYLAVNGTKINYEESIKRIPDGAVEDDMSMCEFLKMSGVSPSEENVARMFREMMGYEYGKRPPEGLEDHSGTEEEGSSDAGSPSESSSPSSSPGGSGSSQSQQSKAMAAIQKNNPGAKNVQFHGSSLYAKDEQGNEYDMFGNLIKPEDYGKYSHLQEKAAVISNPVDEFQAEREKAFAEEMLGLTKDFSETEANIMRERVQKAMEQDGVSSLSEYHFDDMAAILKDIAQAVRGQKIVNNQSKTYTVTGD